jgi:amino acid permease
LGRVIYDFFYTGEYADFENDYWGTAVYKFPIMFGICAILIPLCLLKDISKMRIASLFSICSLLYAIAVIIVESPWYYSYFKENNPTAEINWFDISKAFEGSTLYFFPGTATVFFAYTCHVGAFPVYKTLTNNISRRINKVFKRSIILDAVIYVVVGICGFLTFPIYSQDKSPDLIIYREKIFSNDIAMTIAKMGIILNLTLSTPANYNAFRLSILETIWKTNEVSNRKYNIII